MDRRDGAGSKHIEMLKKQKDFVLLGFAWLRLLGAIRMEICMHE